MLHFWPACHRTPLNNYDKPQFSYPSNFAMFCPWCDGFFDTDCVQQYCKIQKSQMGNLNTRDAKDMWRDKALLIYHRECSDHPCRERYADTLSAHSWLYVSSSWVRRVASSILNTRSHRRWLSAFTSPDNTIQRKLYKHTRRKVNTFRVRGKLRN